MGEDAIHEFTRGPGRGSAGLSILNKAGRIMRAFRLGDAHLSLTQLSHRTGLPKSTVHRVVKMLVELGALARDSEEYTLGPMVFVMGSRSPEIGMRELARPYLKTLAARTGQTVQFAVLRDREVLYLEKVQGPGSDRTLSPVAVGDRLGAHMPALGKAILAFSPPETVQAVLGGPLDRRTSTTIIDPARLAEALDRIRDSKAATDTEEVACGLRCVAVPVLQNGRAVAAVSIPFGAADGTGQKFVGALHETAIKVARALREADAPVLRFAEGA
ncbi:IclR family transcriptional regulator [Actinocorallia sp. B10E7]|uniref:IclR family transcriptional regulator n=1 Tax=Actinocorallia sp. B10E7 TaxID=3153558 RepID=UPI00325D6970